MLSRSSIERTRLGRWRRAGLALALAVCSLHGCATVDARQDARIEAEVKSRLVAEKSANLTRLGVVSREATVSLTGGVESPDQKALAERIARSVPGVKHVVNNVDVR